MKPQSQRFPATRSRTFFRGLGSIFSFGLVSLFLCGAPKPASNEPKTHTLFMGADLLIEYNHAMYRVLNVDAGAFVIKVNGDDVRVLADWSKIVTKVDHALKMTDASASVTHLKSERSYTPGNDPALKLQREAVKSQLLQSDNLAAQSQSNAGLKFNGIAGTVGSTPSSSPASTAVSTAQLYHDDTTTVEEGMFDALDVRFEISSPQALKNPYVIFLGRIRAKNAGPGETTDWVYAQALPPVTDEVRKIHVERSGFPRGFELLDFQVHLYEHGREIATEVAPKRVALTREEAFTYALMEYVSSHKGATLPASAFMGKLSTESKAQLGAGQFDQAYYVKVSKDGSPITAFSDSACSQPVEGKVASLIQNVRFYPALEKGKAVEGVAELKFSRLVL